MLNFVFIKNAFKIFLFQLFLVICFPAYLLAAENNYSSTFINQSKQVNSKGFTLIKTRAWPESGCILDSGKKQVNPGDSTLLVIKKAPGCDEAGVGYSFYKVEDLKRQHLLGYISHRFRDGGFSLQVSSFCYDGKCILKDLNPDQQRK